MAKGRKPVLLFPLSTFDELFEKDALSVRASFSHGKHRDVTQMGEFLTWDQDVAGSSPVVSIQKKVKV